MHIKRLKLLNFKSHAETVIDFAGITSIIGKNDSGKTNILRALKILLHHADWPVSWIRYGEDSASIELTLVDGTVVTRTRTKTNQTVSILQNGVIEVYEGKRDATEFIQKAVKIKKITLDEASGPEDLNFLEVHDGPYLVGGRPDTVSRKIAGIVGANTIEDARSRLSKQVRELEKEEDGLRGEISQLLPLVERDDQFLERLNQLLAEIQGLDQQWQSYHTQSQKLNQLNYHIEHSSSITNVVNQLNNVIVDIFSLRDQLNKVKIELEKSAQLYHKIQEIAKLKDSALVALLEEIIVLNKEVSIQRQCLLSLTDLQRIKAEISGLWTLITENLKQLQELWKEQKVCPLCKSKVRQN